MVLYSAVSSPLDRSKRFTLSSPGRPVHSDTVLGFSWKHSSHIARYSFIQLSRLRRREVKENAKHLNGIKGDSNPGYLDCESGILPLSHRAPGDTLGMLIWLETINGILCCFGGYTDK